MLLDILALLCTLRMVFGMPVPVRLADTDNSAAVEEADIPKLANSSSPFTNSPGPAIPGTLDIPIKQTTTSEDAVRATLANTTEPFVPVDQPDTPLSQATSNDDEDALMALLSRIANTNSEGHDAKALTALLTNSTAEQATSNKGALLSILLANNTNSTTTSGKDKDTLMALLIDADTTVAGDEATLFSVLANTPGPILPRDATPNAPPRAPSSDDALMTFLAHASRSSSLVPQVDASAEFNTTQLISSSIDEARAKGRNPLGRTWEQLLDARDEDGEDVPIVLMGMEECEVRMKRVVRRNAGGHGEGESVSEGREIGEQGMGMDKDRMNELEGDIGERGNWWCF